MARFLRLRLFLLQRLDFPVHLAHHLHVIGIDRLQFSPLDAESVLAQVHFVGFLVVQQEDKAAAIPVHPNHCHLRLRYRPLHLKPPLHQRGAGYRVLPPYPFHAQHHLPCLDFRRAGNPEIPGMDGKGQANPTNHS